MLARCGSLRPSLGLRLRDGFMGPKCFWGFQEMGPRPPWMGSLRPNSLGDTCLALNLPQLKVNLVQCSSYVMHMGEEMHCESYKVLHPKIQCNVPKQYRAETWIVRAGFR